MPAILYVGGAVGPIGFIFIIQKIRFRLNLMRFGACLVCQACPGRVHIQHHELGSGFKGLPSTIYRKQMIMEGLMFGLLFGLFDVCEKNVGLASYDITFSSNDGP